MTLAQLTASLPADADFWRTTTEGLCTILAGLLAFMGRRVLKAVDALDEKFDKVLDTFEKRNSKWQVMFSETEMRIDKLEGQVERRKRPRA